MRTSSGTPASRDGLRLLGRFVLQVVAGAILAGFIWILPVFRVDLCDDRWQTAPVALLAVAGLAALLAIRFAAARVALLSCALALAGLGAWTLVIGNALGCE